MARAIDSSSRERNHGAGALPRVLLVTPPLVQPNAPYAATPLLTGFLQGRGVDVRQADASLDLVLRLLSPGGVSCIGRAVRKACRLAPGLRENPSVAFFLRNLRTCVSCVGPAVRFLQGRSPGLARRIAGRRHLPEGPRFAPMETLDALGPAGIVAELDLQARARHVASLFVDDLADVIREAVDPNFGFARYGEKLAAATTSFADVRRALDGPRTLVTDMIDGITAALSRRHRPGVVGFTVPFPGTLVGALRMARQFKRMNPDVVTVLGGGYVSTELRNLADPGLFEHVDFVVLDEAPAPLLRLLSHVAGRVPRRRLMRTFALEDGRVEFHDSPGDEVPHRRCGAPAWDGLRPDRYLSVMETPNRAYSLWSDGMWNKIMLAHGCYWHRCRFCDTTLPYIRRFDPVPAETLVKWISRTVRETGNNRFHFVDEAIPPAVAGRLSVALLERNLGISWWGNVRFEPSFDDGCVSLMRRSGCVAVTGGLETLCDRTLAIMDKGITVESAVPVIARFARAGILVHVYLMYGFPGQTVAETVDAMEILRQLFRHGLVQSAYWHRFALTVHSVMGADPAAFGMRIGSAGHGGFARNEVPVISGVDPRVAAMGPGLHKAAYNFMHGLGMDEDVRAWFDAVVPRPRVGRSFVSSIAAN